MAAAGIVEVLTAVADAGCGTMRMVAVAFAQWWDIELDSGVTAGRSPQSPIIVVVV